MNIIDTTNMIVTEEKIDLGIKSFGSKVELNNELEEAATFWGYTSASGVTDPNQKIIIERNLSNDTFNMKMHYQPGLYINGKKTMTFSIDGTSYDSGYSGERTNYSKEFDYIVRHNILKEKKFTNSSSFTIGQSVDRNTSSRRSFDKKFSFDKNPALLTTTVYAAVIEKRNQSIPKGTVTNDNQVIKFRTINTITANPKGKSSIDFKNKKPNTTNTTDSTTYMKWKTQEVESEIKISYNNIYLVPRKSDRYSHNTVLFDVYMSNDDGTDIFGDISLSGGYMKTSATGTQKYAVDFIQNRSNITKNIENKEAQLIGRYEIGSYSSYDYDKQATQIGVGNKAQRGELIPYSADDYYQREIHLDINTDFTDHIINQTVNVGRSVLDPTNGSIELLVSENENTENFGDIYEIDWMLINRIRNNDKINLSYSSLTKKIAQL